MRRQRVMVVLAGAAAVWCAAPLAVSAAPAAWAVARAGTWRTAIEVPGLGSLDRGGDAQVWSVSCGSAGNCAAGGGYRDGSGHANAFVVSERNGRWGRAIAVPGLGTLNAGGGAYVTSVSCASAGNCVAGGAFKVAPAGDGSVTSEAFVVSERNGSWGKAIEVPGSGALDPNRMASVTSVSCASAGNCAAGGYATPGFHQQAFVASERNGKWGRARLVPGVGAVVAGIEGSVVNSVSCGSAGNCVAGGGAPFAVGITTQQAFVVSEVNGRWHTAIAVPGLKTLNAGGDARVESVSCRSAGNCAAGGFYTDSHGNRQAFVVGEVNGRWHTAIEVPGSRTLNPGGGTVVTSLSCASAGNCAAGGTYYDGSGFPQLFVVSERNGTWGKARQVPGSGALNVNRDLSIAAASLTSVSCASAGNCAAGGFYTDGQGNRQVWVVSEMNGTWHTAIEVPGTKTLNAGVYASVTSVSCRSAGNCAAGGYYSDSHGHIQAFVVSQA